MMWGMQLFNTVLACLDFLIFAMNAQNEASALYDVKNETTKLDWCVHVAANSMSCIETQRGNVGSVSGAVGSAEVSSLLVVAAITVALAVGGVFRG